MRVASAPVVLISRTHLADGLKGNPVHVARLVRVRVRVRLRARVRGRLSVRGWCQA